LNNSIKVLETQNLELKSQLSKSDTNNANLTKMIDDLMDVQKNSEELINTNKDLERKIETTHRLIEDNNNHLHKLNRNYSDIQTEINDYKCQTGSFKGKSVEELTTIKEKYEKEREALLSGLTPEEVTAAIVQKENERDNLRSVIFRKDPQLLKKGNEQIVHEKEDVTQKVSLLAEEIAILDEELSLIHTKKREKDIIQQDLHFMILAEQIQHCY